MKYLYSQKLNYEDYASDRVLYNAGNIPNFPVRLQTEMFSRAKSYLNKKSNLKIYDPCCGGGYSLVILGFIFNTEIGCILGSDINLEVTAYAHKNLFLLSKEGMSKRIAEIQELYDLYHKESHLDALESYHKLEQRLINEINIEIFTADCTKTLPKLNPDIIIIDVPYGNLTEWNDIKLSPLDTMLECLHEISNKDTILAVCMDKRQKITCEKWRRLEKENIGKRRFEILRH